MVNVFLFGKRYQVPASATIMEAMEYAGYQLVRGCGCRNGFCGACATIYRIAGDRELHACLACSTQVQDNMYVATLPFFPLVKEVYDIEKVKPSRADHDAALSRDLFLRRLQRLHQGLSQSLNVMQYLPTPSGANMKSAPRSPLTASCAASALPAARRGFPIPRWLCWPARLNGKYLAPHCDHLDARIAGDRAGRTMCR